MNECCTNAPRVPNIREIEGETLQNHLSTLVLLGVIRKCLAGVPEDKVDTPDISCIQEVAEINGAASARILDEVRGIARTLGVDG